MIPDKHKEELKKFFLLRFRIKRCVGVSAVKAIREIAKENSYGDYIFSPKKVLVWLKESALFN